jgi:hypothetical protein
MLTCHKNIAHLKWSFACCCCELANSNRNVVTKITKTGASLLVTVHTWSSGVQTSAWLHTEMPSAGRQTTYVHSLLKHFVRSKQMMLRRGKVGAVRWLFQDLKEQLLGCCHATPPPRDCCPRRLLRIASLFAIEASHCIVYRLSSQPVSDNVQGLALENPR